METTAEDKREFIGKCPDEIILTDEEWDELFNGVDEWWNK